MKRKTPFYIILFKVRQARRALSRSYMETVGLSPGQPKLLHHLAEHGSCLQKDLAAALDVEPGTISKQLNSLEELGLISRGSIAGDKRAILVSLTEEGRIRQKRYAEHMREIDAHMLRDFTDEEKEQFEEMLCRVYKNLTDRDIM